MAQFEIADLTPEQLSEYKARRSSYFKGTIAVACIYGGIAVIMLLIAIFSPTGKAILTDTMLPFTITFISGMIIVVVLLLIAIFTAKPPPPRVFSYDSAKCPDYWKLQPTPKSILNSYDGAEIAQMRFRCVNPGVKNNVLTDVTSVSSTDVDKLTLLDKTSRVYQTAYTAPAAGDTTSGKLNCNIVYPDYMNYQDMQYDKNDKASPNRLRCAYAKQCGISWSSVCPDR